jgi:hypothetical protein
MDPDRATVLYRKLFAGWIRLYPKAHRQRFGEGMMQTFDDLLRERRQNGTGLLGFVVWTLAETSVAIFRQNTTSLLRCNVTNDSARFFQVLKYSAITLAALMAAGIGTLMILARGTGEDITGIVAPAILIAIVSVAAAVAAAILQRRAPKPITLKSI